MRKGYCFQGLANWPAPESGGGGWRRQGWFLAGTGDGEILEHHARLEAMTRLGFIPVSA